MEVLRVDFKSSEALGDAAAAASSAASSAASRTIHADRDNSDVSTVWTQLFRHLTLHAPLTNRLLPKVKAGRLMLEVGSPPEWRHFDVALAGSSTSDLGLYYYTDKCNTAARPLGCVRLHSAHIDVLEEVIMVVTVDKTWFLCADHSRAASDWAAAICAAIEQLSLSLDHSESSSTPDRRRLSNTVSDATLREIQTREPSTRATEFLDVFVASTSDDVRRQALHGALSWSCIRSVAWKLWLEYIPTDVPLSQWTPTLRSKRARYAALRTTHALFTDTLAGNQSAADFIAMCETADDALVYDIYKDVRRTRCAMAFFRDTATQALLVRVLYTYSVAHPEVSYNQGMGELLATVLYLLHIEQWPVATTAAASTPTTDKRSSSLSSSGSSDVDDTSYIYVESCSNVSRDDIRAAAPLDSVALLKLTPFAGTDVRKYTDYCRGAVEQLVQDVTDSAYVEHDAFGLLEELMFRMAGAYCPDVTLRASNRNQSPQSSPSSLSSYVLGTDSPRSSSSTLTSALTTPLYDQMNEIHCHILGRCDPVLARHLTALHIEPQMFSLRWVRVLLAREFALADVWRVWDAIFSLTPSDCAFLNLLCVAAVREFRAELLAADDATSALLCFRDLSDRVDASQLVDRARELYEALLIAAAAEAAN